MRRQHILHRAAWAAGALAMAGSVQAGVITGTGTGTIVPVPAPSSTQLGLTDAVAMKLAESGSGHMLVFPYFSTQAGHVTVVRLVNSDLLNGKAVKLNVRGAANGDMLLNFQVLLAPGDIWTGTLTQNGSGFAQLSTGDKSCTYPALPATGVALLPYRLNPQWSQDVKANHTREGLLEAIVMADIAGSAMYGPGKNARSALFTTIKPVNGKAPCAVSVLDSALLPNITVESHAAGLGFATPSGGLSGNWSITDTTKGAVHSGVATAFAAVDARGNKARGNFVVFPQTSDGVPDIEKFTSDPLLIPGANGAVPALAAAAYDVPDLSTPYYRPASEVNSRRARQEISELLSANQAHNQFSVDPASSSKTDWVFSMPTRRYYLGFDYAKSGSAAVVRPRAVNGYTDYDYFGMASASATSTCNDKPFEAYMDRETRDGLAGAPLSAKFCGASSVLSFNGPTAASALSASLTVHKPQLPASINAGWARINSGNFVTGLGLPLIGASFSRLPATGSPTGAASTWTHHFDR